MDVSAPCIEFARRCATRQTPHGAQLDFVVADVAELGARPELDCALGLGARTCGTAAKSSTAVQSPVVHPRGSFERPFGLIYSTGTLHHLPPADLRKALRALWERADPRAGVMVCSFHAFTAASLLPSGSDGYACVRGLIPAVIDTLVQPTVAGHMAPPRVAKEPAILLALRTLLLQCRDAFVDRVLGPACRVPPSQQIELLRGMVDAASTQDDGGGLGACLVTGQAHMGIPGRYERHYTKQALQEMFTSTGWYVDECRDNTADETGPGTEGQLIYVVASRK
jgi:hypothetical protein